MLQQLACARSEAAELAELRAEAAQWRVERQEAGVVAGVVGEPGALVASERELRAAHAGLARARSRSSSAVSMTSTAFATPTDAGATLDRGPVPAIGSEDAAVETGVSVSRLRVEHGEQRREIAQLRAELRRACAEASASPASLGVDAAQPPELARLQAEVSRLQAALAEASEGQGASSRAARSVVRASRVAVHATGSVGLDAANAARPSEAAEQAAATQVLSLQRQLAEALAAGGGESAFDSYSGVEGEVETVAAARRELEASQAELTDLRLQAARWRVGEAEQALRDPGWCAPTSCAGGGRGCCVCLWVLWVLLMSVMWVSRWSLCCCFCWSWPDFLFFCPPRSADRTAGRS